MSASERGASLKQGPQVTVVIGVRERLLKSRELSSDWVLTLEEDAEVLVGEDVGVEHDRAPRPRSVHLPQHVLAVTGEELVIRLHMGALGALGHVASHGLTRVRPQPAKSPTLRVASSAPATRAVAAIGASKASIGRPSRRRPATISA